MPLRDHFHGALKDNDPPESLKTHRAAVLCAQLNRDLPRPRFRATACENDGID